MRPICNAYRGNVYQYNMQYFTYGMLLKCSVADGG